MTEIVVQEQLLECAICMEQMDENCKMLPCQHTYCKICLERMYEHEGLLNCPQCRKEVPNPEGGNLIDNLPTNLILLSLLEQVKRNPPRLRNENEELQAAISNSIDDFQKEKTADLLLKHNEQLQTQLALESSKRDILLKNAQDMSEEMNELFLSQRSHDEETFKRENQNLLSEKEKLEVEVAMLKSEQENPDYITELISWFETNHIDLNQGLKKKVENVLKNLRKAKVTQRNDSIQRRLRTLLENLKIEEKLETPTKITETAETVTRNEREVSPQCGSDEIVDIVNKKLQEVKSLLKNESHLNIMNTKTEKNHPSEAQPLLAPQQPHAAHQLSYPSHYMPPPLMSVPRKQGEFTSNYYHYPYYGTQSSYYPPYYPPASNYPPVPRHFGPVSPPPLLPPKHSQSYGKNPHRDPPGDKYGRFGHRSTSSTDLRNLKLSTHRKPDEKNEIKKSLILPDVRDYDQLGKKMGALNLHKDGNRKQNCDKMTHEKDYQLPTASRGEAAEPLLGSREVGQPLLMLPDVRYYDKVYPNFTQSRRLSTPGDRKNYPELSGPGHLDEKKNPYEGNTYKYTRAIRGNPRGRGRSRYHSASKSSLNNEGFESDASDDSVSSVSSRLSTCSTPAVFHEKKRSFFSPRGKPRGSFNRNFQKKKSNDSSPSKENSDQNNTGGLKKIIYPSKKEAQMRNLDVKKPFDKPLVCLGKNGAEPISYTVQCLADIYAFEQKYTECKLIAY